MTLRQNLDDLDAQVESPVIRVASGMHLMSKIETGDLQYVTMLIAGVIDFDLRCAIYHAGHKAQAPATVRDLMLPEVTIALDRYKAMWQAAVNHAIRMEEREEQDQKARTQAADFERVAGQFKGMNAPAPEGTVDELCKRFGVSKSHVRMLKREGRLHELVDQAVS